MNGSKKQIKWADEIKKNKVEELKKKLVSFKVKNRNWKGYTPDELEKILEEFLASPIAQEAVFWIDKQRHVPLSLGQLVCFKEGDTKNAFLLNI